MFLAGLKMSNKIIPREKNKNDVKKRFSGKVKWFNNKSGFGKIIQSETCEEIHFHFKNILSNDPNMFRTVENGKIVEFQIGMHKKGKFARKITEPGFIVIEPKMKFFRNFQKNPMRLLTHEEEQSASTQ